MLGNGFNYGWPPRVVSIRKRDKFESPVQIIDFDPPDRLDPLFLDHFQQLLELHKTIRMQLIPSLVNYEFFATNKTARDASGGRGDIAEDAVKRNTFLFTVLADFLSVSQHYRDFIYAWEVINEPVWDVCNLPFTPSEPPHIPYVQLNGMIAFITLALDWIKDKKFPSTVGHRYLSDLSILPTGTLPQFHYYAEHVGPFGDPPTLPTAHTAKAGIIGEFGALVGKGYESRQTPPKASYGSPWDQDFPDHRDRDPSRTVLERLSLIKLLGYDLALAWPDLDDKFTDDTLKISQDKLAQIKRFVSSV
ncbi:MAG: hypothetical protein ACXWWJ_04340 [Nitrospira sp.]